ncbi:NTP transferase domain-containing protein [Nocardioides sp.]|uniref:nucleotidyltransferase family protein n=1 Tax=Nocardioides sp. TaxID=35761 RepID=UPI00260F4308|nr:NTP transferase domain-containing protein [Nocardioides sp.]
MTRPSIAGIVAAAGLGVRMGGPKADLVVDGVRLLDRAINLAQAGGCEPVLAVIGPRTRPPRDVRSVVNPSPGDGMRSSLALGIGAVTGVPPREQPDAIALLLVDQPGLTAEAIAAVVQSWRPGRISTGVVVGRDRRIRTHPVVMSPAQWQAALILAGPDEGARRYLAQRADLIDEVEVDVDPMDLDTPADLDRWNRG